jgi:hypothetical protein
MQLCDRQTHLSLHVPWRTVTRAARVHVCLLRAQQVPDGAQLSRSATLAALVARQAIAGLTPRGLARAPPVSEARSTVTQGSTRTTRPGAFGTVPPAVCTITQIRPTQPTTTRSRSQPVCAGAAPILRGLRMHLGGGGAPRAYFVCRTHTHTNTRTYARMHARTQHTHALAQTRTHATKTRTHTNTHTPTHAHVTYNHTHACSHARTQHTHALTQTRTHPRTRTCMHARSHACSFARTHAHQRARGCKHTQSTDAYQGSHPIALRARSQLASLTNALVGLAAATAPMFSPPNGTGRPPVCSRSAFYGRAGA